MERNLYWVTTDWHEGYGEYVVALSRSEANRLSEGYDEHYLRAGEGIENRNMEKEKLDIDYSKSYVVPDQILLEKEMIIWKGYCKECGFHREVDYYSELCEDCK